MSFLLHGKQAGPEQCRFEQRERAGFKSIYKLFESRTGYKMHYQKHTAETRKK